MTHRILGPALMLSLALASGFTSAAFAGGPVPTPRAAPITRLKLPPPPPPPPKPVGGDVWTTEGGGGSSGGGGVGGLCDDVKCVRPQ
jgi:hypothetical protein